MHGIAAGRGAAPGPPLLIIAGAGSGKTMTLAARVAHLIVHGADPSRILLLTFSRRAAAEMERRVAAMLGSALGEGARGKAAISWSGTFHAVGARLLRAYADRIGLSQGFSIHDREDAADLMDLIRHDCGLAEKKVRFPLKGTCLAIYSHAVNSGLPLTDVLARHFPWCASFEAEFRNLFDTYVGAKQAQGVLDFDDLLLYWAEMMEVDGLAAEIGERFDHVLVDEYQDTNPLQARVLAGLKPGGRGLSVVGDDAQAIYGFRAATVRNILDFPKAFTPPADVITLEQNYRSTEPILAASNAVIGFAAERFTKDLHGTRTSSQKPRLVTASDDLAQVGYVCDHILAAREAGVALKSQAVLFRTAQHSTMLELELVRRKIPFVKFGGLKFLDAAHIKDMLSVLRWASNPSNRVAAFRALQLLPGIGPATAARAFERVATSGAPFAPLTIWRPPAAAQDAWPAFVELLETIDANGSAWPAEIERVRTWFTPHLEERYPDAVVRAGDLDQLVQIAGQYASRERFLTELTLDPPDATSDHAGAPLLDEDYLILSTVHSAKGQEWKNVYVLNVVDGCIPSDMATGSADEIEEERRLLYVAMTRARDELHLLMPQRFFVHQQQRNGDRHVFASRTRFIPSSIVGLFALDTWPRRTASADRPSGGATTVDLKQRVGTMWKQRA